MKHSYLMRHLRRAAGLLLASLLGAAGAQAQTTTSTPPKQEMRAVWVAHVFNLDWPRLKTLTPTQQRADFISLLDRHKANGINAVVVQVRASADAIYPSTLEPWSEWMSGTQGVGPQPAYDPLQFMIQEAHKRSMEFHAWINPYRAVTNANTSSVAASHVSRLHPDWIVPFNTLRVLNPGLPAVRQYLTRVVMDVVRRYDVDGIHFDDYFYPAPQTGVVFDDDAAFAADPRGFTAKADWRRDNIDVFVHTVSDSIQAAKPWVKFGISPPGVWRNGTSVGGTATTAFQSYTDIFADSRKWLQQGWVDYLAPQVYWTSTTTAARYDLIVPWWNQQVLPAVPRHVYVGHAAYKVSATATDAFNQPTQIPSQLRLARQQSNVKGSLFYKSTELLANPLGVADSLRTNFYRSKALVPAMPWKDNVPPTTPVQAGIWNDTQGSGFLRLSWQPGPAASDGQVARWYVVYKIPYHTGPATAADLANPANIASIQDSTRYRELAPTGAPQFMYTITALDRLYNESAPVTNFTVLLPAKAAAETALLQPAYPNPFAESTELRFRLPTAGAASLLVYDVTGRVVSRLLEGQLAAGPHTATLRAGTLPAGIYVVRLRNEAGTYQQKVLLTR
ncbi:family 10 glycosylhydrolase [Hymenobacter jeollabukensis]|uniref:T9SS type A sorting domain-containing protein n=1 Tax=Hymenobacter jeollabukensis TaxID=2025313 RepID=A0A5R8WU78_9BACT|nr:family 10 glycosylhydrolase [Hymenobacter jeollabukensis]TLM95043.1 T9SS type A sorting domain-containing protein [Hymenobacter jeollabukensis]